MQAAMTSKQRSGPVYLHNSNRSALMSIEAAFILILYVFCPDALHYCLADWLPISRRNGISGPTGMYS
jgi:hypothetical protein